MMNNFLDIPQDEKKAQILIAPFGFEATTTFGHGTNKGPEAILKASSQVELFDEELWQETYKKTGIMTLKIEKPVKTVEGAKKQIAKIINQILKAKKIPVVLGGEHSITPFIIEAFFKNFLLPSLRGGQGGVINAKDTKKTANFSILQFDAHADLRDGYLGQKYSHAAAMRRCLDFPGINLVQIGIRNISNENDELVFWEKNQNRIKTFWAKDKKKWKAAEILENLKENVYLTFDVDAFDCSLMPSTGTPEPGGLFWDEVLKILRAVCAAKKIIGADFVELSPIKNFPAPDFLVAKLIYKFIGYIIKKDNS